DEAKLRYVSHIAKGRELLARLMRKDELVISKLSSRFGIHKMVSDQSRDSRFIASFLYYFGVVTIDMETPDGKLNLKVPNLVIYGLYIENIKEMLLPDPFERDDGVLAAEQLYTKGNMKPLCDFIETSFFKVFHNPDYKWANELTVKTIFLTLLYNDILFIMDSEQEIGRRYTDLTMIVRPDMRRFKVSDILIEFKYIKLKEAKITGEKAGKLTEKELQELPVMKENMEQAKNQVRQYGDELERKYSDLRLRRYAVVSLGFERLWWEEILKK
ncbi:MAG: AAA family ATPase, partial [Desulfobacteraceae bacterium]|nr:AAA family ATPase [Desulfobacteraceae bacterium]